MKTLMKNQVSHGPSYLLKGKEVMEIVLDQHVKNCQKLCGKSKEERTQRREVKLDTRLQYTLMDVHAPKPANIGRNLIFSSSLVTT